MKKKWIYSGCAIICLAILLAASYKLMNSRSFQVFGGITAKADTKEKVVALTFDDGPSGNVKEILSILQHYNIKATFFLIGNEIEKYPNETKSIVEAGHQVGNHTYSHKRMVFKSPSYIKTEIDKTDKLIKEAGYNKEIVFRPPNGKKLIGLPYYLHKINKKTITWNLEPDTYYDSAQEKIDYAIKNIKPGSIVLMHPMYDQTGSELQAIEGIIKELKKKDYSFVTVNELRSY
ncbi:polysaccharide deacetylase family protein [Niallia nealsonii]|uniref:Polysaccharide deacetylase n=1 Tax=Niallia nealsonii TaxID=115979 RepID=A0A2N0Z3F4_9BACI|nr:polysaccharide deacetylase family protein [Niallia nealsonii]PKG24044.1 polysaccharide deacetylase [Niallia nealsonii]